MKRSAWAASVAVAIVAVSAKPASAQEAIPLYCLDSTGVAQSMKYVTGETLRLGFRRQFNWNVGMPAQMGKVGRIDFSKNGTIKDAERISYDIENYEDGVMLRAMHIHLAGKIENVTGTEMCLKTQMIALRQ